MLLGRVTEGKGDFLRSNLLSLPLLKIYLFWRSAIPEQVLKEVPPFNVEREIWLSFELPGILDKEKNVV